MKGAVGRALAVGAVVAGVAATTGEASGVRLGVRIDARPFVFAREDGSYGGFLYDLCRSALAHAGVAAGAIELVPVEAGTRFDRMDDAEAPLDLLSDPTTITMERASRWDFTQIVFFAHSVTLARKRPSQPIRALHSKRPAGSIFGDAHRTRSHPTPARPRPRRGRRVAAGRARPARPAVPGGLRQGDPAAHPCADPRGRARQHLRRRHRRRPPRLAPRRRARRRAHRDDPGGRAHLPLVGRRRPDRDAPRPRARRQARLAAAGDDPLRRRAARTLPRGRSRRRRPPDRDRDPRPRPRRHGRDDANRRDLRPVADPPRRSPRPRRGAPGRRRPRPRGRRRRDAGRRARDRHLRPRRARRRDPARPGPRAPRRATRRHRRRQRQARHPDRPLPRGRRPPLARRADPLSDGLPRHRCRVSGASRGRA